MNNFLNNEIEAMHFCQQINRLISKNIAQAKEIEENLKFKTDIHVTSESVKFSRLISSLRSSIEMFNPDLIDDDEYYLTISENRLRDIVKEVILPQFSKYYDPD